MKQNFLFFTILCILLIFTYFFEELQIREEHIKKENENKLFDSSKLGELKEFIGPFFHLKKINDIFYTSKLNYPVGHAVLNDYFKNLSHLRIKRYLSMDEVKKRSSTYYIKDRTQKLTFIFTKGKLEFILGNKQNFDTAFYMEVKNNESRNMIVAHDPSAHNSPYVAKDVHLSSEKYDRLVYFFSRAENYFLDSNVFKIHEFKDEFKNFKKVTIKNIRNRTFDISFVPPTTKPVPIPGIKYNYNFFQVYLRSMMAFKGMRIFHPGNVKFLNEEIASIDIHASEKLNLKLFRRYADRNGYFLKTSFDKTIYELDGNASRLFFSNVQDFWNRRILKEDFLKDKGQLKFFITFKEKQLLALRNIDSFQVLSERPNIKPKNSAFLNLFKILEREADMVKKSTKNDGLKPVFSFGFHEMLFHVIFKGGDLIIKNILEGHQYHYYVGEESPILLKEKAYF